MNLTEEAQSYAMDRAAPGSVAETAIRRAFMAGADFALRSEQPRESLLAECRQYGRAIGTAAERATS